MKIFIDATPEEYVRYLKGEMEVLDGRTSITGGNTVIEDVIRKGAKRKRRKHKRVSKPYSPGGKGKGAPGPKSYDVANNFDRPKWKKGELRFIRSNVGKMTWQEMAEQFGRSERAVYQQYRLLNTGGKSL